jgi:ATP-dependent Clp protease ATP-binding subunit ClpC
MMRFGQFTERAQDSAMRAYEVLQRYGQTQVDTEHMLLALLEQPDGVIPEVLEHLGVDPQDIWPRVDEQLRRSPRTQIYPSGREDQVYITPRLKRVIDQAYEEASRLEDDYISTEHLFLAIVQERNTPSARILANHRVKKMHVLEAIAKVRGDATQSADKAQQAERRRAKLVPLPLEDVTIEVVMGDEPAVVLIQGEQTITIEPTQVLALVGALANASMNLAEAIQYRPRRQA